MRRARREYLGNFGVREFVWPVDIAIDGDRLVYITDEFMNHVAVCSPEGERLRTLGGTEAGKLSGPTVIAFDADQNVYAVESLTNRGQRFSSNKGAP